MLSRRRLNFVSNMVECASGSRWWWYREHAFFVANIAGSRKCNYAHEKLMLFISGKPKPENLQHFFGFCFAWAENIFSEKEADFFPFELCYCFVESTAMGCQSPSFHAVFFSSLLSSAMTTNHHILAGLSPCTMWPDKLHPKMPQLWCYHISICFASYSRRRHSNGSVQLTFGISFQLTSVHFHVDQHVCT